jgi:pyruvate/2-oxoglutarate dehydrogenase complex dihydrolipoamide dehydrogenase (E3) component
MLRELGQPQVKSRIAMVNVYDVLVIGTGTAGYTLSLALRKAGRRVAVVDNRPYGGTCAMRGCQPKKYLVAAAEVAHLSPDVPNRHLSRSRRSTGRR